MNSNSNNTTTINDTSTTDDTKNTSNGTTNKHKHTVSFQNLMFVFAA